VNTAAKAVSWRGLKRRALSLGAVKTFDHAMQFLLPVLLARCLDAATFGEYRLLWLTAGTVLGLATFNMAGGLYYFLPRADARHKRLYVHQTLLFLGFAGLLGGLALGPWNPLLPAALAPLERYDALVPAFVALWVASALIDYVPTVEERIGWQAFATASAALSRVALVGAAAWFTGELAPMIWALIAVLVYRLVLLLVYVHRHHGLGRPWFERPVFSAQFRHCAPFGVSNALYQLRAQSDQWVAATLFAVGSFAAFSIAALLGQVVHLVRHSVMEAFMPTMSRLEAGGDVRGMMAMNARANGMVGKLLFPLLAYAFVFAEDLVTLAFTAAYAEAGAVMRVYVAGMALMVVEVGSLVLLLNQGAYALRITALVLPASVALSWAAAQRFGLPGAALGSVAAIYFDRALLLHRVSRHTGVPLRRIQDWRGLALTGAAAAASGAAAWLAVPGLGLEGPFARVLAGGAVLAAVYAGLHFARSAR
jgi:O-antigen/teichoic acid export membrane protein